MRITAIWDIAIFSIVEIDRRFESTVSHHLDYEGSTHL